MNTFNVSPTSPRSESDPQRDTISQKDGKFNVNTFFLEANMLAPWKNETQF